MKYRPATEADVQFFDEHGWIVVDDVIDPADLVQLEARCDEIIANKEEMAFDWAWEKGEDRTKREFRILQGSPSHHTDEFDQAPFRTWAVEFASTLMGFPVEFWYDQFLAKPGDGKSVPTLWHQDEGYWGRNLDDKGITCWMPFHDVDVSNGCMQFIDGGHRDGVLEHRRPANIQSDLLMCEPDEVAGRGLPDPAGQCHVPPQQDTAHDDRQRHPQLAADPDPTSEGGRRRRRGRPLPVEGVRQPVHG